MNSERIIKAEVYIPLTKGKVAVIDFEDFEIVRPYKWYAKTTRSKTRSYAGRRVDIKTQVWLHREIMKTPVGMLVDHRDGDGLNCRRYNMRNVTDTQNKQGYRRPKTKGTSIFRGVHLRKDTNRWKAELTNCGKRVSLGYYSSEIEAAKAYDAGARKYFGEHAAPNLPI